MSHVLYLSIAPPEAHESERVDCPGAVNNVYRVQAKVAMSSSCHACSIERLAGSAIKWVSRSGSAESFQIGGQAMLGGVLFLQDLQITFREPVVTKARVLCS